MTFLQYTWLLVCLAPLVLGIDIPLGNDTCGGNVTESKKSIDMTKGSNTSCVWRFSSNATQHYFAFTTLDLAPADYVLVYDDDHSKQTTNVSEKLVGNFTGKLDPFPVVTFSKISTIIYHRGENQSAASSFMIQYNTNKCEVSMKKTSGTVRSPLYYPTPQGTLTCTYHVMTDDVAGQLALTFDSVNLTKGDVSVWSGNSTKGPILTNATGPLTSIGDVINSGAEVLVQTVLPTSRIDSFAATFFTVNHACGPGGMYNLTMPMNVTTPGYPNKYPNNLDCRYVFIAPEGFTIAVDVKDLDLGDNVDEVTLTDGDTKSSPVLASLTAGFKQDGFLLTSGNKLWLRIRTDESRTGRGFKIVITPKAYGGAGYGQGRIVIDTAPAGKVITTPSSDDVYFVLYAKQGMQVSLTLNETKWAPLSSVEFHDGSNVNGSLIGYFGAQGPPVYTIVSSGSTMLVVAKGFLVNNTLGIHRLVADFTSVLPGTQRSFSEDSGSVTLKESGINGSATYIILNQDPTSQVALQIQDLYVPVNATVTIYQGPSGLSIPFMKYMTGPGESAVKAVPVIYINETRIKYQLPAKPSVPPEKVILQFSYSKVKDCGNPGISKALGVLTSPQYPNQYPANAFCSWTFIPVQNKTLRLSFNEMSLAANHTLTIEADHHFVIHDGNTTITNMTTEVYDVLTQNDTNNLSDVIIPMHTAGLNTTRVKVTFNAKVQVSAKLQGLSNSLKVSSGFKISYEHLVCGGNMSDPSKALTTPGYPNPVSGSPVRCVWLISLPAHPASSNTSVNIINFNFNIMHYNPNTSKLEIRDGGSELAAQVPITMKEGDSGKLLSRTNKLWILYSHSGNTSKGFALSVKFSQHECEKKDQCDNGVCMHPDWRCNGKDECGDDSDERDCYHATNTVSRLVLGMAILVTFIIATILACGIPALYKRFKYPHYSELRDLMTPVPT